MENTKHFVLVHGASHGGWCWYKLVPLLKSAGHRVTTLDLAACGINPKQLDEIASFSEYVEPLMEFMASLPPDEKVILVGHSYGGLCISLAMEWFPEKILVAVFVTAYMPNYTSPPSTVIEQSYKWTTTDSLLDCQFTFGRGPQHPPTSATFGPNCLETMLYQNCPPEDLELAKMLVRPWGVFLEDMANESLLTKEKFGSVSRVFIVCQDDLVMKEKCQRWMIENSPPNQVKLIAGADHMAMLSKPKELCLCFQEIAENFH